MRILFFLVTSFFAICAQADYKKFVVLMTGHNVEAWCRDSLKSALVQDYQGPWRIIFVADAPTDNTVAIAQATITSFDAQNRISLVVNEERKGAMYNQYYTTTLLMAPEEIVVILDADDFFANNKVLSYLNSVYADQDVWLTYGQFKWINGGSGFCKPYPQSVIEQNAFRSHMEFLSSHPRTYYAWLFQYIRKEDLMRDGAFFDYAPDLAAMLPMLEMARHGHIRCLVPILYIYNDHNPNSESNRVARGEYKKIDHALYIRSLPPYAALEKSPLE